MSEFLGEASVLIRPDTKAFRATLQAELAKATKGVVVNVPVQAGAGTIKNVTQATTQQTQATKQLGAAQATQAVQQQKLFTQNKQLVVTAEALQKAELQLAAAANAGALKVGEVAKSRAVLRATTASVATAEKAVSQALLSGNAAALAAARNQLKLAAAQEAVAAAAYEEALALKASSGAAIENAQAHGQATRGAVATGASMLGLRGAVLSSSGPFLAATIGVTALAKSLGGASDDAEALAKVSQVLGPELGERLAGSARQLSFQIGVSDDEILKFQGTLANLLSQSGFTDQAIVGISEHFVKLGRDLAQFGGVDPAASFKALQLGLTGNLRALRQYGIVLTTAEIKQRALNQTGKESVQDLTRHEIAQARLNLITRDAASIAGAYEARQGGLSAQSKILKANIDDLSDSIGEVLLPLFKEIVTQANLVFVGFRKLSGGVRELKQDLEDSVPGGKRLFGVLKEIGTTVALGPVVGPLRLVRNALQDANSEARRGQGDWTGFASVIDRATQSLINFYNATARALRGIRAAHGRIAGLQEELNDLIIAGAGPQAIIANKQAQIAQHEAALRNAERLKDVKRIREEKGDIAGLTEEIRGIEEGIAADQEAAANAARSAAEAAAREAQAALDAADAAVQATIARTQALHQLRSVFIDASVMVKDDIKEAKRYRKELQDLLRLVATSVHDEGLRTDLIIQLTTQIHEQTVAIRNYNKELKDNEKERRKARRERAKRRREEKEEALELNIQIAEAQEDVKRELAARRAHLRNLQKRLGQLQEGTNAWRKVKLEIEQEKKAIRDLLKETKERGRLAASLQFEFMRQQQGFAATLLGNLIPGAAARGTVGSGTTGLRIPGTGQKVPGGRAGAGLIAGAALGAAGARATGLASGAALGTAGLAAAGAPRGASQAQTGTMIELLRGILRVLQKQGRNAAIPEAQYDKAKGSSRNEML